MSHELVLQLVGMVACAAAIYGGLRADLRHMLWRLDRIERHVGLEPTATGEPRRRYSDRDGF
jgi:hypothetical protein